MSASSSSQLRRRSNAASSALLSVVVISMVAISSCAFARLPDRNGSTSMFGKRSPMRWAMRASIVCVAVVWLPELASITGSTRTPRLAISCDWMVVSIFAMNAVRNINPTHIRTARALRLSPWATARTVLVPAALPEIVTGIRVGFSLTLIGTVLGEMFASQKGLGYLLMNALSLYNVDLEKLGRPARGSARPREIAPPASEPS